MRTLGTLAIVALAGALSARPAAAQDPQTTTTEFEPWQLPGWTVTPGVIVGGMYDSNVALAFPPADTHNTASDQLFVIEPYGQVEYVSPRTNFFSGYRGFVRRYTTFDNLDSVDHTAYTSFRERLTRRVTVYASDSYLNVPTTEELELNGVPFQRTGSRYDAFSGGVEARVTRTTDFTAQYDLTWVDFSRNETLLSGGTINGVLTDLVHHVTSRVGFGGEYTLRWADLNVNTRLLSFQEAGALFRYGFDPDLTLEVAGGISHLTDQQQMVSRTGPYFRADLTDRARRATIGAHAERRYTPSLAFGASNQSEEVSGFVQMPITRRRVYVEGSVAWRNTDPILTQELPLNSVWIRATGGYALQRWLRIEVYDAYSRQDTRLAGGLINRTVAGVQLVIAQPMRIQ